MNKLVIGIVIGIILIITILMLYYYFSGNTSYLFIERQDGNNPYKIMDEDIVKPADGYNYSMAFFIYLNDYTENFKYWKHILHKGDELRNTDILDYTDWDQLTQDIPNQSPGIWLSPQSTLLRLSFTVEINKYYCNVLDTKDECDNHTYCKWDNKCVFKDQHATKMDDNDTIDSTNGSIYEVDYIDIEIPLKKMVHLSIVLENKILNVYLNGTLRKVHKFVGEPIINNKNMFFNQPNSYSGSMFNFNYIPYEIKTKQIEKMGKDIPNVSYIPKNVRFNNYLGRFKFKKAIQSFFI